MSEATMTTSSKPSRGIFITGWVITGLVAAAFIASEVMKFAAGGPDMEKELDRMGMTPAHLPGLGVLELICVAIYLIPQTAMLGAILLTGYMGGAICTHWRIGDPNFVQIIIGILVWLGLYLRDKRLWTLMPIRK